MNITDYRSVKPDQAIFTCVTDKGHVHILKHMIKGDRSWVSFASVCYELEGQKKFLPTFSFGEKHHDDSFLKLAKSDLEKYLSLQIKGSSSSDAQDLPF